MEWIYDRTQEDVEKAKEINRKYIEKTITEEEKINWSVGMKGALNASDLNRIESNTAVIAQMVGTQVITKEWTSSDIPRESDYFRIRENIQHIRDAWYVVAGLPPTPTQPLNTYQKWNDIEKILHDLYYSYEKIIGYFCGTEVYAGEGIGII